MRLADTTGNFISVDLTVAVRSDLNWLIKALVQVGLVFRYASPSDSATALVAGDTAQAGDGNDRFRRTRTFPPVAGNGEF